MTKHFLSSDALPFLVIVAVLHCLTGAARTEPSSPGQSQTATRWDGAPKLVITPGVALPVTAIAFSVDGKLVVTGTNTGVACVWDLVRGYQAKRLACDTAKITSIALTPDGRFVMTAAENGAAKMWDTASGKEIRRFEGDSSILTFAGVSPDGRYVVTGSADSSVRLWETQTGREVHKFQQKGPTTAVAFSPDGKFIATGDDGGIAHVWEASTGKEVAVLEGHHGPVTSVAFSPDGRYLATAGVLDRATRIWDASSGRELRRFEGPMESIITSISFSPDGARLVAAAHDGSARLWDVAVGREIRRFVGTGATASFVAISPDGRFVVAAWPDGMTSLLDISTGRETCRLISFIDGTWATLDAEGRYDGSESGNLQALHWSVQNEPIPLSQLKERYYEPMLLAKVMGFSTEPLHRVAFGSVKLFPTIDCKAPAPGTTKLTIKLKNRGGGIGRVRVLVNGKEVVSDARSPGLDPQADRVELGVELSGAPFRPGSKNEISVQAYNAEGWLSGVPLTVEWDAPGKASVAAPEFYAIVAGISQYSAETLRLRFAAKDAENMAMALELGANRLFGKERVHVALLRDQRATKTDFVRAFEDVGRKAKPGDLLVVYLSGRGVLTSGAVDTYCYLTHDASGVDLSDTEVRRKTSVTSDELTEWIKSVKALKQVLILDTTFSATSAARLTEQRSVPQGQVQAFDRMKDRTGLYILVGRAADGVSYEASAYAGGVVTHALLEGMKGAALREGGSVDVSTLFSYAAERVSQLARNIGGIDRPAIVAPRNPSFSIGLLTVDDRLRVGLAMAPIPLILRPTILNKRAVDDLNLTDGVRKRLQSESYGLASAGGTPSFVYVDADDLPDAIRPVGLYEVEGNKVKVNLVLVKNALTIGNTQIAGTRVDLDGLATAISEAILESVKKASIVSKPGRRQGELPAASATTRAATTVPKVTVNSSTKVATQNYIPRLLLAEHSGSVSPSVGYAQAQSSPPLVARPSLRNSEATGRDTLGLELSVREYLNHVGTAAGKVVQVDADDYPGAFKPKGTYEVKARSVVVRFSLFRNALEISDTVRVSGVIDDLATLSEMIAESIIDAIRNSRTRGVEPIDADAVSRIITAKGKDYALLIAIDHYNELPELNNPIFDARAVAQQLKDDYGFEEPQVLEDPDLADIYRAIKQYSLKSYDNPRDQLFIFIAGHGAYDEGSDIGYLAARDSKKEDEFHTSYISFENLRKEVDSIKCQHIFLVLDSCYSGGIRKSSSSRAAYGEASTAEFIARKMPKKTRQVLTSSGKDYTVGDGDPKHHSPFAHKFLLALDTHGGNNGVLSIRKIWTEVETLRVEPKLGIFGDNDDDSDFLFVWKHVAAANKK
jgi:WD40 repeat protein/uncharacterized caspase-like protein